ncbi:MAG: hypothetical protein K2M54_06765 [Muribaculaceae bacterium]|nr:hypothetical protein [Muribaculaceae bacterium]
MINNVGTHPGASSYAALAWAYYSQRCDAASLRPTLLWKLMGALALRWPQSGYRMVATCKRRISGAQLVVTVLPLRDGRVAVIHCL